MWEICEDAKKELVRELFSLLNAMCEDFELICSVICRTCSDVGIYTDYYRRTQINCHQCGKKLHAHQSCSKHRDYVECSCYQVEYGYDMVWFIETAVHLHVGTAERSGGMFITTPTLS
jgi:hypothetical protein